jgi:hypothetical protein
MLRRQNYTRVRCVQVKIVKRNQTRTRTNTNPNDTEANAAGRSVRARDARKSKS